MAILSKVAVLAFAALAVARPLARRDIVTEVAYTTVDVPVTLWVNEQGVPISTQGPPAGAAASTAIVTSSASPVAQAVSTPLTTPTPMPVSSAPAAPISTTPVAPVAQTTDNVFVSVPVTSVPASTPASSASPSVQTSAAPVSSNSGSSGQSGAVTGSSTASCQGESNACQGDITHWDGGLGACGWNVNSASDMQIALPFAFMGTQSNGNPYCGKSLTILNPSTGKTVQATVGDKCMGCTGRSIDLTDALFDAIGNGCDGRCSGFDWWFN